MSRHQDNCLPPAVLQINNQECPTLFHRVTIPAEIGDDKTYPPKPGLYRNTLLVYEANHHVWMYSSDGVPTLISDGSRGIDDYNELTNKPSIGGHELAGDSSLEDIGVTDAIEDALEDYTPTSELAEVAFTGDYDDLIGTPTLPTKTSNLTNDGADGTSTYVEADELATVATSGEYSDLLNKPAIPAAQVNSDWNANSGVAQILNKPTLATVATSGLYSDLTGTPNIPIVNNATLTIQRNGTSVGAFTANASSNVTANISVPTKTSDLTNDGADNTSTYIETDDAQKFAIGQGSTNPVFDDMTPVKTIEWDVTDQTYRPIYQMANTGWTYINMDITVSYRITVTGTNIHSVTDIVDRWHNPISYPITSMFCRTLSSSGATTGLRYLRAVYPVSTYLNNASYPLGTEIAMYNSTARHVKIEVFKDNSQVTWNTTKPSGPIYVSSTYNNNNVMSAYDTRGWKFRQPAQMYASNAGYAEYISNFEPVNTAASELKNGATVLAAGHYAFLADDGLVYDISNTAKNIAMCESKVGFMNSTVTANAAISYTYWRAISRPNATQVEYIPHDTLALGNRVFLRCTMDSSGNVHSDNYLSTTMSAGYTWMPFGWARSATTLYVDTRFPMFYTLNADGKLTHINGKEVAGSEAASVAWEDITGKPTFATVATSGSYNDLSNKPTIPAAQVNSDWNANSGVAEILNKPTIPTVNNATLTIAQNGTSVGTFTANASSDTTISLTDTTYSDFSGATSSAAGTHGLVPAPSAGDQEKVLHGDGTWKDAAAKLVEMSYGESDAWAKFIAAYQAKQIVYCRASSNSNPGTGTQGRKAFMAYVNNAENPTEVEFQYVRSVSSKTSSQPVDQVYVYKLTSANGGTWTVQIRDMGPKLAQGTNTTVSYSNGTYTISATQPTVPTVVQTTGQSTTDVMSQKAVTDIIGNVETILQTLNNGGGAQ